MPTKLENTLLCKKNVVGFGIGEDNKVACLVTKKVSINELAPEDLIPKTIDGRELGLEDNTATDVIEIGNIRALNVTGDITVPVEEHRKKRQKLLGGISIGGKAGTGTLGMVINVKGTDYIVSNNHVLADTNKLPIGSLVVQPGPSDSDHTEVVGKLHYYVPINFTNPNRIDFAVAKFAKSRKLIDRIRRFFRRLFRKDRVELITWDILGLPNIRKLLPLGREIEINDVLYKSGRTTGVTSGTVLARNASVKVDFGYGVATFTNQIITTNMSTFGDSGSCVFTEDGRWAGLLFAGSDTVSILNTALDVINYGIAKL